MKRNPNGQGRLWFSAVHFTLDRAGGVNTIHPGRLGLSRLAYYLKKGYYWIKSIETSINLSLKSCSFWTLFFDITFSGLAAKKRTLLIESSWR
jgi:hypothetical protein